MSSSSFAYLNALCFLPAFIFMYFYRNPSNLLKTEFGHFGDLPAKWLRKSRNQHKQYLKPQKQYITIWFTAKPGDCCHRSTQRGNSYKSLGMWLYCFPCVGTDVCKLTQFNLVGISSWILDRNFQGTKSDYRILRAVAIRKSYPKQFFFSEIN